MGFLDFTSGLFFVEFSNVELDNGRYPWHIATEEKVGRPPFHWKYVFRGTLDECVKYIDSKKINQEVIAKKTTWRGKKNGLEREKLTKKLRYEIIKRDGGVCKICGRSVDDGVVLNVDHIIPLARGGKTERTNLQTLCWDCNIGKGVS